MKILILFLIGFVSYAQIIDPDQILVMRNQNTGIKEYEYHIKNDDWLLDLAYTMNAHPMKAGELSGFRAQLSSFQEHFAWTGYFANTTGYIDDMMSFRGNFEASETQVSFTEVGIGISRRSNLINDFWSNKNVYDEISAVGIYSQATSSEIDNSFSGYGLVATYSILYRPSPIYHLGLRIDYHLHSLEDSSDALNIIEATASWVSLNASLGFYF